MTLKNIMLNERSHSQKGVYVVYLCYMKFKNRQNTFVMIRITKVVIHEWVWRLEEGLSELSGMMEVFFFFAGMMASQVYDIYIYQNTLNCTLQIYAFKCM